LQSVLYQIYHNPPGEVRSQISQMHTQILGMYRDVIKK
jgi:hypothetical protein